MRAWYEVAVLGVGKRTMDENDSVLGGYVFQPFAVFGVDASVPGTS